MLVFLLFVIAFVVPRIINGKTFSKKAASFPPHGDTPYRSVSHPGSCWGGSSDSDCQFDETDPEKTGIEPLIPPAKRGGNRRHVDVREVVNGLMYVLSTGCQWRAIPKDLPPRSTLHDYFDLWGWDGTLERIHEALYVKCREAAAREASPTAAIIDSQSVKSAEKGGAHRPFGLRRRQEGQRQEAPHPGRYAGPADARHRPCRRRPGPRRRSAADGDLVRRLSVPDAALRRWRLSGTAIQARNPADPCSRDGRDRQAVGSAKTFVVLPKRWIVERTLAWLGRCRRLAKDWECLNHKALAFLRLASIRLMLRKLCNPT